MKPSGRMSNPSATPTVSKATNPTNTPISKSLLSSSPSIPLYPILILFIVYHLISRLFSYRNRTKVSRKLKGMLGSKQFSVSQEELRGHIAKLKKRSGNHSPRVAVGNRGMGGDDAAGGIHKFINGKKSASLSDKCVESTSDGSLNSTLMQAISESLNLLKDEKEELIHQRRLLLHDRDCTYDEKELAVSEKKLIQQLLSEKVDECQKALKANQKLKEAMKLMEAECAGANDTAQNLADMLAQTKTEKEKLKESLEKKRRLHADAMASVSKLRESLKESEAQIEKLTNENIILNNVIGRLEVENNEMEKVIDEACRSDNGEMDIDEIDVADIADIESLTKDEDDADEVAMLREEKESLEKKVDHLQQSLNETRSELDRLNKENSSLAQARSTLSDAEVNELQQLLDKKQSELDKLSITNQELTTKLSQLQTECDILNSQKPSSLQQARISSLESKLEEMQKLLTRTQLDLEKKARENADVKSNLSRVQNERDTLQQQIVMFEESIQQSSTNINNEGSDSTLQALQMKNSQLQNSLADIESLYKSLCIEKSNMEQSIEITSDRFKSLLSEKETIQSSLRRERKRITWCSEVLQGASQSASSLIAEIHAELKRGDCIVTTSDGPQSPTSELSDGSSESKTLMHNAEVLQQQLQELKQTNQQLIAEFHRLNSDSAEVNIQHNNRNVSMINASEVVGCANHTFDTTGSDSSGELNVIQQMIDNAKKSKNAKVSGEEMKRLVRSLENDMKSTPKMKRDKSNSPTNSSPTLPKALSMRRLWRKKSSP
jgi:chromosome segregation ATPase